MMAWVRCSVGLLLCLWLTGTQAVNLPEACTSELNSLNPETSNFLAYTHSFAAPICTVQQRCNATVRELSGMSWFIEDVKVFYGETYNHLWIQQYNVRCPPNHLLHMYIQSVETVSSDFPFCNEADNVVINVMTNDSSETYQLCGTEGDRGDLRTFNNNGLGRIYTNDATVTVDFCSNSVERPTFGGGFVIRATCLNYLDYYLPGCVDYQFALVWDPESIRPILEPIEPPQTLILPHKRSVDMEAMEKNFKEAVSSSNVHRYVPRPRRKRGVKRRVEFPLEEGDRVRLVNNKVIVTFANTTMRMFDNIQDVTAYNSLTSTRVFKGNSSFDLRGPGSFSLFDRCVNVVWTLFPDPQLVASPDAAFLANHIYDYIYRFWVRPYPIIDDIEATNSFPLPNGSTPYFDRRRPAFLVAASFPRITPGSECRQAIISNDSPHRDASVSADQFRICSFLQHACDLTVRTACRELIKLDPHNPAGRMMMGIGD